MSNQKGKLIVFEGTDGSGKATQLLRLKEYLDANLIENTLYDFPRYSESLYADLIGRMLKSELGPYSAIDPHIYAAVVAADRRSARDKIVKELDEGKVIISNRYTGSNKGHQTARVSKEKREKFLTWLDDLEYGENQLPREDIVIFLYVPVEFAIELNKKKSSRDYLGEKKVDEAEKDYEHQKEAEEVYLSLVDKYDHWVKIDCVKDSRLRSIDEIHEEIIGLLLQKNIL